MSNVIPFKPRAVKSLNAPIIHKEVNGKTVECVDVDAMSPRDKEDFFSGKHLGAPMHKGFGAPDF